MDIFAERLMRRANNSLLCITGFGFEAGPLINYDNKIYHPNLTEFGYVKNPDAISFTGHRPEVFGGYDESLPAIQEVKKYLRDVVWVFRNIGHKTFISGGALGVDQWAAEAVLEYKDCNLIFAVPFEDYGSNWPVEARAKLQELKKKASAWAVVCAGEYAKEKNHERNLFMIHNSKHILSVWDGRREGGTASAVRHAKSIGKSIFNYNFVTKKSGWING